VRVTELEKRVVVLEKALEMALSYEGVNPDGGPLTERMVERLKDDYIRAAESLLAGETLQVTR